MNLKLKRVYFFFSSLFVFIVHLPLAFAKTTKLNLSQGKKAVSEKTESLISSAKSSMLAIYDSLNLRDKGLSEEAFADAINGYTELVEEGKVEKEGILSIADFSKSSASKRLFVIDLKRNKILYNTYVAHGQNSGAEYANKFSNVAESLQSSPGFYVTSGTYTGSKGFSLYLKGMEKGINDKAYERSIVMHAADYVSEDYIRNRGYIGRSWGCPAVPEALNKPIINTIKGGTCLFIFTKDKAYQSRTKLANAA